MSKQYQSVERVLNHGFRVIITSEAIEEGERGEIVAAAKGDGVESLRVIRSRNFIGIQA